MGERQSDGKAPARRAAPRAASRPAGPHPAPQGTGPGFPDAGPSLDLGPALDALVAAVRGGPVDPEAEGRAIAAFRAAREQGTHADRSRRRDDWRPREQRRASRSLRAALAALIAGLALGGVAFAGIGPAGLSFDDGRRGGGPSSGTTQPAEPPGTSAGPTGTNPLGRSPAPQDTEEKKPAKPEKEKKPKKEKKDKQGKQDKKDKKDKKQKKKDEEAGVAGETEASESAKPTGTIEPKKPKSGTVTTQ
ncbi:hypothetical protein [Streptomyces sp. NPDC058371]|uniref:hypothetical protein n=1 Tax=Streptomyces sp. NPDC058371 TaxID=3346463 RepID=UPI00365A896F